MCWLCSTAVLCDFNALVRLQSFASVAFVPDPPLKCSVWVFWHTRPEQNRAHTLSAECRSLFHAWLLRGFSVGLKAEEPCSQSRSTLHVMQPLETQPRHLLWAQCMWRHIILCNWVPGIHQLGNTVCVLATCRNFNLLIVTSFIFPSWFFWKIVVIL